MPHLEVLTRTSVGTVEEAAEDPRHLATAVSLRRQVESLHAALTLEQAGLGHLAVSFVRPAVEEVLWLKYLRTLDGTDARDLLISMSVDEGFRSIAAERNYRGREAMINMGFPDVYLDGLEQGLTEIAHRLKEIGQRLGWGKGKNPRLDWVAEQGGESRLYEHLHPASSRAIHFSAGEIFRRGWFDGVTRMVEVDNAAHRSFLTAFAFDQLIRLCVTTVVEVDLRIEGDSDEVEGAEAAVAELIREFVDLGEVPLIAPEEFNLVQGAMRFPQPDDAYPSQ
jgi:hypothetical protein